MMARGTKGSKQRPDTLMQGRTSPTRRSLLATHGRTIHWVISRQSATLRGYVRFTPKSGQTADSFDLSALCQKRMNAPQQNFLFDHRAERSGAHRTKNRRLCGARAKPPAEVAGPKSYSADLV